MYVIVLVLLSLFVILASRRRIESFDPMSQFDLEETAYEDISGQMDNYKNLRSMAKISHLRFPLNVYQSPLLNISVAENSRKIPREALLAKRPPNLTLAKWINNYSREVAQYPQRKASGEPVALNDRLKGSTAENNTVPSVSDQINAKLVYILRNIIENPPRTIKNPNFREIFDVTTQHEKELLDVSKRFIDRVNNASRGQMNWKYIDREDSKIAQYYAEDALYTRYNTVLTMFDELGLLTKTVNITLIRVDPEKRYYLTDAQIVGFDEIDKMLEGYNRFENNFVLGRTEEAMKVTQADIQKGLKERQRKQITDVHGCFGSVFVQAKNRTQCEGANGIWDSPAKTNIDCPYYKSNKNYPNDRGGTRAAYKCSHPLEGDQECTEWTYGGKCEMPQGVQIVGYKHTSPTSKPLCYNCISGFYGPKTIGDCCKEQKDKIKYPTLNSPDYAFNNDTQERYKFRNKFRERGLSWHPKGRSGEILFEKQLGKNVS